MISREATATATQNRATEATERNEKFPGYDQVLQILEASPEMKAEIESLLAKANQELESKPVSKETIAAVVYKLIVGRHINR